MRIKFLFFTIIFNLIFMAECFSQTIYLLKQWHLPPKAITTDIETSKKLSQFKNQKDLYQKVNEYILGNKIQYLLSEGCEKVEIDENFKAKFNGWGYVELDKLRSEANYDNILTLLPLKVEVQYKEKIKTFCVDNLELIHESQLQLSDIRAYIGYASRLEEFKNKGDDISYERYAKSLLSAEDQKNKLNAIAMAKEKALAALDNFEKINLQRESKIVDNILSLKLKKKEVAAFIIGGIHAENLAKGLKKANYNVEVYTPNGYVENDKDLINEIKGKLK